MGVTKEFSVHDMLVMILTSITASKVVSLILGYYFCAFFANWELEYKTCLKNKNNDEFS